MNLFYIPAVNLCFAMPDIFGQEVLAVVMQQIVDEPVLPILFLRTVIQAVQTYRSLIGFVSTTLLSRLITKKIWQIQKLWEGFIRCAKLIAPASFGALLQLPKEQLKEIIEQDPSLRAGLREFVIKRAGNKARVQQYLEVLGEESEQQQPQQSAPSTPPTSSVAAA
jgi:symplekin